MAETSQAHTEVPAPKEPFPPFERETFASQLVWLAITFVLLYVVMAKVALPRMAAIFETRRAKIAGDLAESERLKQESEAALGAYEKALADARGHAQTIASQTRDELGAQTEARRKALEEELNAKLAAADKSIAATKQAAMANVRGIAVETAGAIIERLIGAPPAAKAVEAAVEDALKH